MIVLKRPVLSQLLYQVVTISCPNVFYPDYARKKKEQLSPDAVGQELSDQKPA